MKILYVAYPLVKLGPDSCGGAEQMLHALEEGIAARGHETVTVACAGSRVAGRIVPTGASEPPMDAFRELDVVHNTRVLETLRIARDSGRPFDLVHDEGGSFWTLTDAIPEPVLLTAHLGRDFYGDALRCVPPNLFVNCVSDAQRTTFDDVTNAIGTVQNGIVVRRFPFQPTKDDYLLWLGRICEEKGAHIAIEVGRRLGLRTVIAGDIYNFSYHQKYFEREILPHLGHDTVQLFLRPSFETKVRLLAKARAVLIPSLVEETSSLVAMEAAACGTPVIAFRRGALPEVVEKGKTGFIVDGVDQMAQAVAQTPEISSYACRHRAEQMFDAEQMITQYEALYWRVRHLHERQSALAA